MGNMKVLASYKFIISQLFNYIISLSGIKNEEYRRNDRFEFLSFVLYPMLQRDAEFNEVYKSCAMIFVEDQIWRRLRDSFDNVCRKYAKFAALCDMSILSKAPILSKDFNREDFEEMMSEIKFRISNLLIPGSWDQFFFTDSSLNELSKKLENCKSGIRNLMPTRLLSESNTLYLGPPDKIITLPCIKKDIQKNHMDYGHNDSEFVINEKLLMNKSLYEINVFPSKNTSRDAMMCRPKLMIITKETFEELYKLRLPGLNQIEFYHICCNLFAKEGMTLIQDPHYGFMNILRNSTKIYELIDYNLIRKAFNEMMKLLKGNTIQNRSSMKYFKPQEEVLPSFLSTGLEIEDVCSLFVYEIFNDSSDVRKIENDLNSTINMLDIYFGMVYVESKFLPLGHHLNSIFWF